MSRARANADATSQTYIENATVAQALSGTYSTERLYFNDSYQLTGDVTVTGHLALGSIADEDIIITNDGTERTITGAGTLEAGNVLQDTHRTSLTDMTGELGSAVTGSPNLNLGNATFPAGMMRFIVSSDIPYGPTAIHSSAGIKVTQSVTITSGSKILIHTGMNFQDADASTTDFTETYLSGDGTSGLSSGASGIKIQSAAEYNKIAEDRGSLHAAYVVTPTGTTPTYYIYLDVSGSPSLKWWYAYMIFYEIYQ